ncbi:MAG: SUMF1/EgtB/PvdO family nonheme iron enzyme [Candidatus Hydrogenedentes bacterium]|nr:SUMF1/EgtB/PvdO family nonheme iron enzyme [Candidatus Hydrogenedentota bacterium]
MTKGIRFACLVTITVLAAGAAAGQTVWGNPTEPNTNCMLGVPWYVDNAAPNTGVPPRDYKVASFIYLRNNTAADLTAYIDYYTQDGAYIGPKWPNNIFVVPAMSSVAFRPVANDPVEGSQYGQEAPVGNAVPDRPRNSEPGNDNKANGSLAIRWLGSPGDLQGIINTYQQLPTGGNYAMQTVLPPSIASNYWPNSSPMVGVAGRKFLMGDVNGIGESNERPTWEAYLSPFEISAYEVTVQEMVTVLNWYEEHAYVSVPELQRIEIALYNGEHTVVEIQYNSYLDDMPLFRTSVDDTADGGQLYEAPESQILCRVTTPTGIRHVRNWEVKARGDHPMTHISWVGAVWYCNMLSVMHGLELAYSYVPSNDVNDRWIWDPSKNGYHLPTEAQWEMAASWDPATRTKWDYGNSNGVIGTMHANHNYSNPLGLSEVPYTSPVGWYNGLNPNTSRAVSPAGCWDMSGNVQEWCQDNYQVDWYTDVVEGSLDLYPDPFNYQPSNGVKSLRGGCWATDSHYLRTTFRHYDNYDSMHNTVGFRVVRNNVN